MFLGRGFWRFSRYRTPEILDVICRSGACDGSGAVPVSRMGEPEPGVLRRGFRANRIFQERGET